MVEIDVGSCYRWYRCGSSRELGVVAIVRGRKGEATVAGVTGGRWVNSVR